MDLIDINTKKLKGKTIKEVRQGKDLSIILFEDDSIIEISESVCTCCSSNGLYFRKHWRMGTGKTFEKYSRLIENDNDWR